MEHSNQVQPSSPGSIRNYIRRIWNDEFPRAKYSTWPPDFRAAFKQIDGFENAASDQRRILLRVLFDVLAKADEVANRLA